MARFLKTTKDDIGLPPDALLYRGNKTFGQTTLTIMDYNEKELTELTLDDLSKVDLFTTTAATTTWLNVDRINEQSVMQKLSEVLKLDTLILTDVMDPNSRPKMHEYEDCVYVSLKILNYCEEENIIDSENLALVVKKGFLVSFHDQSEDLFAPVRERLRNKRPRIRKAGADYLAFALLDVIIDSYSYIISKIGEKIEELDEVLFDDPQINILEQIKNYKREVTFLRKSIKPCQEVIMGLLKVDNEFFNFDDSIEVHLKDLQSNLSMANDTLDSYRDTLTDLLNVYNSMVSSKLNYVMKILTVVSVIFAPLTFIVGIYGTNFDVLPEIHYKYGYFIMWGVMVALTLGLVAYFRRIGWLE